MYHLATIAVVYISFSHNAQRKTEPQKFPRLE